MTISLSATPSFTIHPPVPAIDDSTPGAGTRQSTAQARSSPRVSPRDAEFIYNSQDASVMPATPRLVRDVGPGVVTPRVALDPDVPLQPVEGRFVYPEGDPRCHAALSFSAAARTVEMFEQALGEPVRWAFPRRQLTVVPDGGETWNAYYDRNAASVTFFHGRDPVTGQTVWSGDSGEVVTHETAHALLDALRPRYMQAWSVDALAFHEAFGDVLAMTASLLDDSAVERLLAQTRGDLRQPNLVAETGEAFGTAVNHASARDRTGGGYVRTALNRFRYQDPGDLPDSGSPNLLTSEPHSFARVWTGAMYDLLVDMVGRKQGEGMEARAALRSAGEEMLGLQARLFDFAPDANPTFASLGHALVEADMKLTNGRNADALQKVLEERRIFPQPRGAGRSRPGHLLGGEPEEPVPISVTLRGHGFAMFEGAVAQASWVPGADPGDPSTARAQVIEDLRRLVANGRIRYNEPGYRMQPPRDYFDSRGRPYLGYVDWRDGQMHVERLMIAS